MNPIIITSLVLGIAVLIFGILTFTGRTFLSKRSWFFAGIELDKTVIGIALFLLGMFLIIIFLIATVGPRFTEEGL